jgi:hypothetical protein
MFKILIVVYILCGCETLSPILRYERRRRFLRTKCRGELLGYERVSPGRDYEVIY